MSGTSDIIFRLHSLIRAPSDELYIRPGVFLVQIILSRFGPSVFSSFSGFATLLSNPRLHERIGRSCHGAHTVQTSGALASPSSDAFGRSGIGEDLEARGMTDMRGEIVILIGG